LLPDWDVRSAVSLTAGFGECPSKGFSATHLPGFGKSGSMRGEKALSALIEKLSRA